MLACRRRVLGLGTGTVSYNIWHVLSQNGIITTVIIEGSMALWWDSCLIRAYPRIDEMRNEREKTQEGNELVIGRKG
jgi:hypothetical protein